MTAILVIDVGTTTIRAAVVDEQLQIVALAHRSSPPSTPAPGLVEFDAVAMCDVTITLSSVRIGLSGGVGSTSKTSSPAA